MNEEGDRNENNIKRNNHVSLYPDGKESTKKEAMESEDDISQSCVRVVSLLSFFIIIIFSPLPYDLLMSVTLGIF
jgi:hypothetical protein